MPIQIDLECIEKAYQAKDPCLPELICALCKGNSEKKQGGDPKDLLTFNHFTEMIHSLEFKRKPADERASLRIEVIKRLEAPENQYLLPDHYKIGGVLYDLWCDHSVYARLMLLEIIDTIPLVYGPWRALKKIAKEAMDIEDTEVLGHLAARMDMAFASKNHGVSQNTLGYMVRRVWRYLRTIATSRSFSYVDIVCDILCHYSYQTLWRETWIANHIFNHHKERYSRRKFSYVSVNLPDMYKYRAYPDLWRLTPRPLFSLIERSKNALIRSYAIHCLKKDFRVALREVQPGWLMRLIRINDGAVHEFVVWLLNETSQFEQAEFKNLNLHEPVLSLLHSPSMSVRDFAATYAGIYARDLSTDQVLELIDNESGAVSKMATDLLMARDPRKEIGIDVLGELLESKKGHPVAALIIQKHFGANELPPSWFKSRLLSVNAEAFRFTKNLLPEVFSMDDLGVGFFTDLIEKKLKTESDPFDPFFDFIIEMLKNFDLNALDDVLLRKFFLHPDTFENMIDLSDEMQLKPEILDINFYKSLIRKSAFNSDPWINDLKDSDEPWTQQITFNETLSHAVIGWFLDKRRFAPKDLGLSFLLSLLTAEGDRLYGVAEKLLLGSFIPADFAEITIGGKEKGKEKRDDLTYSGCVNLWYLATTSDTIDPRLSQFAIRYFETHHSDIYLTETGRILDPDDEIAMDFITFERAKSLFFDERKVIRTFALKLARYEFTSWNLSVRELIALCESPFKEVKAFVSEALFCEDTPENEMFRVNIHHLSSHEIYEFCESTDEDVRSMGIKLIESHRHLQIPDALFQLTESPDPKIRSFAIRVLWLNYRKKGVSHNFKPELKDDESRKEGEGIDLKGKSSPFAGQSELHQFIRRILFEIPPSKHRKKTSSLLKLKPLPTRKSKRYLIDLLRDLATGDEGFAIEMTPLFKEFMNSKGKSEHEACLVALTRIQRCYPHLTIFKEGISI